MIVDIVRFMTEPNPSIIALENNLQHLLTGISDFYKELRHRKVIRVAFVYIIVSWILVQIAETTFEPLQLPEWSVTLVIVLLGLGFPVALVLAWAFELTPSGLKLDSSPPELTKSGKIVSDSPSIAVLPFVDMSPDKDQDYFCDGIAEEILNVLSNISILRVASRTSSFQFKGQNIDIKDIGAQLKVKTVLEGSVRKSGDHLRITAQLINVQDGYHLWSEKFDRDKQDIFQIQEEIASCIVSSLEVTLSTQEKRKIQLRPTRNIEAYEYYLRGWNFFNKTNKNNMLHALDMFNKAIEKDPEFSRAYAALADTYAFLYMYMEVNPDYPQLASRYSKKALEICAETGEAHTSRGMAHLVCEEFSDAELEFEKAIQLSPNLYEAYYFYARSFVHQGKFELAASNFEKANKVRPEDYQSLLLLPQVYRALGREDDAQDAGIRGFEAAEKNLQLNPDDQRALYLGAHQLAEQGKIAEAKRWITKALAIAGDDGVTLYNVACFYSRLGELDNALDCLEKSIVLRSVPNKGWLEHDSDLEALREHPRFIRMLSQESI